MGLLDKLLGRTKKSETPSTPLTELNLNDIWFSLPTISNEFPLTVPLGNQTDFDIQIHEDDFRQNEFLKKSARAAIETELSAINEVWNIYSKKGDGYTVFKVCHVRKTIGEPGLNIPFNDLKSLLNSSDAGQVIVNGAALAGGFVIKTQHTTYYGTLDQDMVTTLCLFEWSEQSIAEINAINKSFNTLLVNWCQCEIMNHA